MGVGRVKVIRSAGVKAPVTAGVGLPLVVLPEWLLRAGLEEELGAALRHELVHVRRRDFLLNIIYELILLPVSFHPAATFIKARVDCSRELVCDELAARTFPTRLTYARALVRVAASLAAGIPWPSPGFAVGLFHRNTLEVRVVSLLRRAERAGVGPAPPRVAFVPSHRAR